MLYLPTNTLHLDRLPSALTWGYIISATHETCTNLNRYRFDVSVRGQAIQKLQIEGIPGCNSSSEVINTKLLHRKLTESGIDLTVLDAIERNSCYPLHHLRGSDTHTACGIANHIPAIDKSKLHLITRFLELEENQQCPWCRNIVDHSYLPVWRFRLPKSTVTKPKPKKVLPR